MNGRKENAPARLDPSAEAANQNVVDGECSPPQFEIQPSPFIALNDRWRVRLNDPLQWILERRRALPTRKSTGWQGRSYCTQRRTLLRDIRDYCGDVDAEALRQVEALPERFPYRRRR